MIKKCLQRIKCLIKTEGFFFCFHNKTKESVKSQRSKNWCVGDVWSIKIVKFMLVLFFSTWPSEAQQQTERSTTGRSAWKRSSDDDTMQRVILKNIFLVVTTTQRQEQIYKKTDCWHEHQGNRMDAASRFSSGPSVSASTLFKKDDFGTTVLQTSDWLDMNRH